MKRTNPICVAAFFAGVVALVAGFMAIVWRKDALLLVVVVATIVAFVAGIHGRRQVSRNGGQVRGARLAAWGLGLPVGGFCLAFLLLPGV